MTYDSGTDPFSSPLDPRNHSPLYMDYQSNRPFPQKCLSAVQLCAVFIKGAVPLTEVPELCPAKKLDIDLIIIRNVVSVISLNYGETLVSPS